MQAVSLPAMAGWFWVKDGWRLFRRQPLAFFSWAMFVSLLLMLATLTSPVGPVVFVVLMPSATYMILSACRHVAGQRQILPGMWLQPFQQKNVFRKLLGLGLLYLAICLSMGMLAFLPFSADLAAAVKVAASSNDLLPLLESARTPILIFSLFYLVVTAIYWYAPLLVGWYGLPLKRALFFSFVACWRNKWPMLIYGLCWAGIFLMIDLTTSILTLIGLPPTLGATAQIPLNIIAASVMYCSFYPNYTSVFEAPTVTE